jgi:F420-non-reducing hydrogenase small subunit
MTEERPDMDAPTQIPRFAVLQLSGCAGCEVSLLNAHEWVDRFELTYMPLVSSAYAVPEVDILLISGGVRTDEDLFHLKHAVKKASGGGGRNCAISAELPTWATAMTCACFSASGRTPALAALLPISRPVDDFVSIDLYLGLPANPELFQAALLDRKATKPV